MMKSMYLVDLKLEVQCEEIDDEIDLSDFYEFEEIDWLIHSLSRYFSALQAVLFDVRKSKTKSMYLISTSLRKSIG
ncbi:hypothetical protein LOK49_LG14G00317 [Camellia lanceoleosa]|uniref:Uncharacterized protein n=1 Tax=Camellia lanceoleosa TaxID=1840588 RepID=A0ACC0FD26_9ERIC|nr:hypothetical protein LOK49_LG14G00317 [Camellia lanceoleosa]